MFAFEARLKIAQFRRPWWINDHPFPPPLRESFRNKEVDPKLPQVATGNPDFKVYRDGDGGEVALGREGQWLSAEAPAGAHRFAFRYRPWDAPLGLALSAIGCLAALWLWIRDGGGSARGGADGQADGDTV
jgi:hypothetical protein